MKSLKNATKLTNYYQHIPTFATLFGLIEQSQVRFSGLFIKDGKDRFLMLKDGEVHVDVDWQAYNILRCTSKTILITGACFRSQPGLYLSREDYGNKHIKQLYDSILKEQKQKLIMFSKTLSLQTIAQEVNHELYELGIRPNTNSLAETIAQLKTEANCPILVQFGLNLMHQYYDQVKRGAVNSVDTILLSNLTGKFQQKFKGQKLDIPLQNYDLKWVSQSMKCQWHNGDEGELTLQVYTKKI